MKSHKFIGNAKRWQGRFMYTGIDKNIYPELKKKHLNGSMKKANILDLTAS
jgi:hypothetical protein